MQSDQSLREHLLYLLRGGGAHIDFDTLVADFPLRSINQKVDGVPYTAWHLLEHLRLAQWDIVRFSVDPNHVSPPFPNGYWPAREAEADEQTWQKTISAFRADLKEMEDLLRDQATDLFQPIPHGTGQTILREALVLADHNSYHLGALAMLKRLLEPDRQK
jgi:DinB superfamily